MNNYYKKTKALPWPGFMPLVLFSLFLFGCSDINSVGDKHFDADGRYIHDTTVTVFIPSQPSEIKFYVEVSGSMNGFFRANRPTQFKADIWNILSFLQPFIPYVYTLTNNGEIGEQMTQSQFQLKMNTGAFISSASTKVPLMIKTMMDNLEPDSGEVAVLVSDMKYSPVGQAAPDVLLTQYSSDIAKQFAQYGKAVSLVCATSDYLDAKGNVLTNRSPYYFLIIGNGEKVVEVRNYISMLMTHREHFIDNIDTGIDYSNSRPSYSFGSTRKCYQLDKEPTFVGYEDEDDGDTCTIRLNINLANYRWLVNVEQKFRESIFKVKALYGSKVKVGEIKIETKDHDINKNLKWQSKATVELKVYDMAMDSEVVEWNLEMLEMLDSDLILFSEFLTDTNDENDPTNSYSVESFIQGMFYGGVLNRRLRNNYILISKGE